MIADVWPHLTVPPADRAKELQRAKKRRTQEKSSNKVEVEQGGVEESDVVGRCGE